MVSLLAILIVFGILILIGIFLFTIRDKIIGEGVKQATRGKLFGIF